MSRTLLLLAALSFLIAGSAGAAANDWADSGKNAPIRDSAWLKSQLRSDLKKPVGGVPIGTIIIWTKDRIPDGWTECDGTTPADASREFLEKVGKVPDLRGAFLRARGENSLTMDPRLKLGGNLQRTHLRMKGPNLLELQGPNMPNHDHRVGSRRTITYSTASCCGSLHTIEYLAPESDGKTVTHSASDAWTSGGEWQDFADGHTDDEVRVASIGVAYIIKIR